MPDSMAIFEYLPSAERVVLLRRYKRFLADVRRADGSEVTVHVPNSGAMTTCWEPGDAAIISDSGNDQRKLRHTLELVCRDGCWVGVNTGIPNRAVAEFIRRGVVPGLDGFTSVRPEVRYGAELRSRIDLLLSHDPPEGPSRDPGEIRPGDCFVEIKNTTLRVGDFAAFPDAKSERAAKHCSELASIVAAGRRRKGLKGSGVRAAMVFFVGRSDVMNFRPADEIDPEYGKALRQAVKAGVEAIPLRMEYAVEGKEGNGASVNVRMLGIAECVL